MPRTGRPRLGRIPISVSIDPDLVDWIKAEAKERRVAVSHIVQELILREMKGKASGVKTYDQSKIVEAVVKALQEI